MTRMNDEFGRQVLALVLMVTALMAGIGIAVETESLPALVALVPAWFLLTYRLL